jgi:hypothetical protein
MRTLQTGAGVHLQEGKNSKERSRTGQSEEDNLLVGELLGSVVGDGDTARGDLAGLLGPGDVAVNISIDRALRALRALKETHENLTSSGKASPALKPLVILVVVKLSEVKVVSGR